MILRGGVATRSESQKVSGATYVSDDVFYSIFQKFKVRRVSWLGRALIDHMEGGGGGHNT